MAFTLHWGILGAGEISAKFVKDVLLDPKTRNVEDVSHKVVAVGSRDQTKAQAWIDATIELPEHRQEAKAYGSYESTVADPNVDAIYIGVPHTYHYPLAVLALNAGKHVLVEKPATATAAELKSLIELAKEKKLFLMEAMWTRFQPIAKEIKKVIDEGKLGQLVVLHADLAGDFDIDNQPPTHRILDPRLGGGGLLDLGPYPMIWAILACYEDSANNRAKPSKVSGSMIKTKSTGVDQSTCWVLNFDSIQAQAILSCSITIPAPPQALVMRFRNGNIIVPPPIYRPESFTVQTFTKPGSGEVLNEDSFDFSARVGGGWYWQADEVARCIRDGKIESETWDLATSLMQMEVFDEVRRQNDYVFPPGVEHV